MRGIPGLNNTPHRITKKYTEGHIDLSTAFFLLESAHWTKRPTTLNSPVFDFLGAIFDETAPPVAITDQIIHSRKFCYEGCGVNTEWRRGRRRLFWFTSIIGNYIDGDVRVPITRVTLQRESFGGVLFTTRIRSIAEAERAYREGIANIPKRLR